MSATTTLELAPADAEFYLHNLNRLPSTFDNHAVTLDLGGEITVRAKTDEVERPTELILTGSRRMGDDVRLAIDRRFLARAAAMKLPSIYLYGAAGALLAQDASRQYLWMPLDPEKVVPPSANCLRMESRQAARPVVRSRPVPPTTTVMNTTAPTPAPVPETKAASPVPAPRRRPTSKTPASSLDQALAVRDQLRAALTSSKELIRSLKTEKRSQKSLKLALNSLQQLQAAA